MQHVFSCFQAFSAYIQFTMKDSPLVYLVVTQLTRLAFARLTPLVPNTRFFTLFPSLPLRVCHSHLQVIPTVKFLLGEGAKVDRKFAGFSLGK